MEKPKLAAKNFTNAKKEVSRWIDNFTVNEMFRDVEFEKLLKFHPSGKCNEIEYLVVRIGMFKKKVLCYRRPDLNFEDDVSWIACLRRVYGLKDTNQFA